MALWTLAAMTYTMFQKLLQIGWTPPSLVILSLNLRVKIDVQTVTSIMIRLAYCYALFCMTRVIQSTFYLLPTNLGQYSHHPMPDDLVFENAFMNVYLNMTSPPISVFVPSTKAIRVLLTNLISNSWFWLLANHSIGLLPV